MKHICSLPGIPHSYIWPLVVEAGTQDAVRQICVRPHSRGCQELECPAGKQDTIKKRVLNSPPTSRMHHRAEVQPRSMCCKAPNQELLCMQSLLPAHACTTSLSAAWMGCSLASGELAEGLTTVTCVWLAGLRPWML